MNPTISRAAAPPHAYLFLIAGVMAAAFAAIFIRFAQQDGMPSLLIAAGRLTLASLLLTPFALRNHRAEIRRLSRADVLLAGVAGVVLAVHFATWIASLEYVSVLVSLALVSSSPLWVALLEVVFLRARLQYVVLVGLALVILGGVIISVSGGTTIAGKSPVLGGALAFSGALAMAVYLVIGRRIRAKLTLVPYIWLVYSGAALSLLLAVAVARIPIMGYPTRAYEMIVLLALVPQLIGHTSFNYALRYLHATYVSIATQMEPVGGAIAAFFVFRELPRPLQIVGSAVILVGVVLATLGQSKER